MVTGIIEELSKFGGPDTDKDPELVNVFGIVPNFDPCWEGNLEELDTLLGKAGLRLNPLFGRKSGVEGWKKIKTAGVNIAFTEIRP